MAITDVKKVSSKGREHADPAPKLLLRRHFLAKYHRECRVGFVATAETLVPAPAVFDACQAGGLLWDTLRREWRVRYLGVDLKPQRRATLKVDSVRILAQPRLPFDIIDIDTFGSPWRHWLAMLPNLTRPGVTAFLTLGRAGAAVAEVEHVALEWIGIRSPLVERIPASIRWKLAEHAVGSLLMAPVAYGYRVVEVQEATSTRNARYLGVRLERG